MKQLILFVFVLCLGVSVYASECDSVVKKGFYYYCGGMKLSTKSAVESILSSCPAAHKQYYIASNLGIAGNVFGAIGGACIGFNLGRMIAAGKEATVKPLWGIGGGFAGLGLIFAASAGMQAKSAIDKYNAKDCDSSQSISKIRMLISCNSISVIVDL